MDLFLHRIGKALLGPDLVPDEVPAEFEKAFPGVSPKYIDSLSLLAGLAAARALQERSFTEQERKGFGVVLGSGLGALDSVVDFDAQALSKGPQSVNPMDFPNTVANAAGSRVGIWLQMKGPNVTLTNGETSFLDALGFAWEGMNGRLFERGLAGAMEKVPSFLRPLQRGSLGAAESVEGACFLLFGSEGKGEVLAKIVDHLCLQLDPRSGVPSPFQERWADLWRGVQWFGGPPDCPGLPPSAKEDRWHPPPDKAEMALTGLAGLEAFLRSPKPMGLLGAYSRAERKLSFVKISKG